jgi:ribosome-associated protein
MATRDIQVRPGLIIPESELSFIVARSGGPGGQNVNKVNSKVTLRWMFNESNVLTPAVKDRLRSLASNRIDSDGCLQITSQVHREQPANYEACAIRLRHLIIVALQPPKVRKPTKPSKRAHQRRLNDKAEQSQRKANRQPKIWD